MGGYIPATTQEQQEMLRAVGLDTMEALYDDIPAAAKLDSLALPEKMSELEVLREMERLAAENRVFRSCFRGAGAYRHYIPAIVKQVAAKESFLTAYTPYQAEVSQGILQLIFEYQSEMCALTGMEVSNASVYDGATAAAEAALMCRERKRQRVLVAGSAPRGVRQVINTYCDAAGMVCQQVGEGATLDEAALAAALGDDVACLYLASPNHWGLIEPVEAAAGLCHAAGAKLVMGCNPIALALFKTPGELGADIAVGEGQPLGMPLAFGGPYLGFMACRKELMRRLPGRIVGQTQDADGRRCFVLTLQAREQHIRREKAQSSICSNQALCALTATAYLAAMGPQGLAEAAAQCYAKAHYAAQKLDEVGFGRVHKGEFFHEFLTHCPAPAEKLMQALEAEGILGGLVSGEGILWCCTELNTKAEIDKLVKICGEVASA